MTGLLGSNLAHFNVMLSDSSIVFSERSNMWKKLFFYISQLVTSSAGQPLTSHRDPNTHKGSVPTGVGEVLQEIYAATHRHRRPGSKHVAESHWRSEPALKPKQAASPISRHIHDFKCSAKFMSRLHKKYILRCFRRCKGRGSWY